MMLENCRLCPRECGVNRLRGERGFCGAGALARIARAAPHFWEEPCISGKSGSGTVFFSNCTMKCVYCQNYKISAGSVGTDVTVSQLADIFADLERQGVNNINLVTPTHYIPQIKDALDIARRRGMSLPVVYNTGGYERTETIRALAGYVDVYMPDFKYFQDDLAIKYSSAPRYREYVVSALDEMLEQAGEPVFDENAIMRRGVLIRHLMLPGHLSDTVKIINYVNKKFGNKVCFSLMSQYTPTRRLPKFPELNAQLSRRAYRGAVQLCERLGMERVFIQEMSSADERFIPKFK